MKDEAEKVSQRESAYLALEIHVYRTALICTAIHFVHEISLFLNNLFCQICSKLEILVFVKIIYLLKKFLFRFRIAESVCCHPYEEIQINCASHFACLVPSVLYCIWLPFSS